MNQIGQAIGLCTMLTSLMLVAAYFGYCIGATREELRWLRHTNDRLRKYLDTVP
jgi:hypothetical protein